MLDWISKKTDWLIYTIIMGLMPTIAKFFMIAISTSKKWELLLNEVDFTSFGLVLSVTNLSAAQYKLKNDKRHGLFIGFSVVLIIMIALIFSVSSLMDISNEEFKKGIDRVTLKFFAIFLALISALVSYSLSEYEFVNKE